MRGKSTDSALARDILEWSLPEEVLSVFGPGYTRVNLFYMRRFYLAFPNVHTLCKQLSWSHYRTLITVENEKARQYYFEEAIKSKWSVRDLQRQIARNEG